jgi:hypothetical protein
MGYTHTNSKGKTYHLHSKDVTLKGGRNQTIYYFAKDPFATWAGYGICASCRADCGQPLSQWHRDPPGWRVASSPQIASDPGE